MADILTIFNLTLADLDAMDIPDLMAWRERARQRSGVEQ